MKLRYRLSIYFTAIILSIIAVLTHFSIQRESRALRNELKSQGQILAFTLADESRRAFLTGHFVRLMGFVESIKGRNHLVYVMVRDIDGIVRAHSDLKKIKKVIRDRALDAVRKGGLYMREVRDVDGHLLYDIAVPVEVRGRVVGVAQVGYSLSSLAEVITRVRFYILFMSLGGLLTGIMLAYFASWHITRPIEKLREMAKAYARGDFDRRIEIKDGDEIAELGTAFNEMAGNLQGMIHELSNAHTFTQGVIASISDILIIVDEKGLITTVNNAAVDLLGYAPEDFMGHSIREILVDLPEADPEFLLHEMESVQNRELHMKTASGGTLPVLFSVSEVMGTGK